MVVINVHKLYIYIIEIFNISQWKSMYKYHSTFDEIGFTLKSIYKFLIFHIANNLGK